MWDNDTDMQGRKGPGSPERSPEQGDPNLRTLISVGFMVILAVALSSLMPGALVPAMMNGLLEIAAVVALVTAALKREKFMAETLNNWDQAAMLFFFSLVCGLFVDEQAATQALAELRAAR